MTGAKGGRPAKPGQDGLSFQLALLLTEHRPVGRVGPLGRRLTKLVVYRVVVNVMDQAGKIAVAFNPFAPQIIDKQGSPAFIHFIIGFGVAVEKIAKLLHHKLWVCKIGLNQVFIGLQALGLMKERILAPHPHQKVKMVGHQAVGKGLADGGDVVAVLIQEIAIVVVAVEEVVPANGVVEEMIILIGVKRIGVFHWLVQSLKPIRFLKTL